MMVIKYFLLGVAILLASAGFSQTQAEGSPGQINNADAAIKKALEFTGFDRLEGYSSSVRPDAQLVTLTGDRTPYVRRLINDRPIWQVSLTDVPLMEIRPGDQGRSCRANFEILIDPDNGKLLKIRSEYVDTTYVLPRNQEPEVGPPKKLGTGDNAPTVHLIPVGPDPNEKEPVFEEVGFAGLPNVTPCAFLDVMRHSWLNMRKAIEIEAVYVLQKLEDEDKALPVWKVWIYGYPDIVNEADNSVVTKEPPPTMAIRTYLQTQLVTADGLLAECRSVEESQWKTLSGDLPAGSGRLYRTYRLSDRHYSDDFSAIWIGFHSHGELYVTDPAGRRTGTDALTDQSYNEIPRATYFENFISSPDGSVMMLSPKRFHVRRPLSGDYKLTVTDTEDGEYGFTVDRYDINNESWDSNFGMAITAGTIHSYTLSFDRITASHSAITGGFDGDGDQSPEVNKLLSYVNVATSSTTLPSGTQSFDLFVIFGATVLPETFTATLNGSDVSNLFTPKAGGYETVTIALVVGENALVLSITGADTETQDTDSLMFFVE